MQVYIVIDKVWTLDMVKISSIRHGIKILYRVLRNFGWRKNFCSDFSENFSNFSRKNSWFREKIIKFQKTSNVFKNS